MLNISYVEYVENNLTYSEQFMLFECVFDNELYLHRNYLIRSFEKLKFEQFYAQLCSIYVDIVVLIQIFCNLLFSKTSTKIP